MYDRILEQTNWYFSWKEYTVYTCYFLCFQNWQKSEIMFFGDIYLYF